MDFQKSVTPDRPRRIRRRVAKPIFTELPQTGLLRLQQFIPHCIGIGRSTWWRLVSEGKAPQPIRLSRRVSVWKSEDLRAFVAALMPSSGVSTD